MKFPKTIPLWEELYAVLKPLYTILYPNIKDLSSDKVMMFEQGECYVIDLNKLSFTKRFSCNQIDTAEAAAELVKILIDKGYIVEAARDRETGDYNYSYDNYYIDGITIYVGNDKIRTKRNYLYGYLSRIKFLSPKEVQVRSLIIEL